MKKLYRSLVLGTALAAFGAGGAGAQSTPIDVVAPGPHVSFEVHNVQVANSATTPSVSFDLYISADAAYVAYVLAQGSNYGVQNVDVAYDMDFGTDGTAAITAATPATPTGLSTMAAAATATAGFTGVSGSALRYALPDQHHAYQRCEHGADGAAEQDTDGDGYFPGGHVELVL